jgi:hypothetical protein
MRIGVLGTGMVGETIATKLVQLGHEVRMGARDAANAKATAWAAARGEVGGRASHGTFADAAGFGELLFNCTAGTASLDALALAGAGNLGAKVLIDLANPLDFSRGFPPTLAVCNDDSLGERIQRAYPELRVVKTLNTVNCLVMGDPSRVPGEHDVFVSGNDAGAKAQVGAILRDWFGWRHVVDLGDITTARGTEMYLPLWVRLYRALGTGDINLHVARAPSTA